jgi:hypothetical protein
VATYQYDPQTRFLARQLTDAPARKEDAWCIRVALGDGRFAV